MIYCHLTLLFYHKKFKRINPEMEIKIKLYEFKNRYGKIKKPTKR